MRLHNHLDLFVWVDIGCITATERECDHNISLFVPASTSVGVVRLDGIDLLDLFLVQI